jgi:hypothetical protein
MSTSDSSGGLVPGDNHEGSLAVVGRSGGATVGSPGGGTLLVRSRRGTRRLWERATSATPKQESVTRAGWAGRAGGVWRGMPAQPRTWPAGSQCQVYGQVRDASPAAPRSGVADTASEELRADQPARAGATSPIPAHHRSAPAVGRCWCSGDARTAPGYGCHRRAGTPAFRRRAATRGDRSAGNSRCRGPAGPGVPRHVRGGDAAPAAGRGYRRPVPVASDGAAPARRPGLRRPGRLVASPATDRHANVGTITPAPITSPSSSTTRTMPELIVFTIRPPT